MSAAWNPIETAPKDGSTFLVVEDDGEVWLRRWNARRQVFVDNWGYRVDGVVLTHWLEIPPMPKPEVVR